MVATVEPVIQQMQEMVVAVVVPITVTPAREVTRVRQGTLEEMVIMARAQQAVIPEVLAQTVTLVTLAQTAMQMLAVREVLATRVDQETQVPLALQTTLM